jgi:hypothetical protein
MSRLLPRVYFTSGAFAPAGPELFASYTCVVCGRRATTWSGFRTHREAGHCRPVADPAGAGVGPVPGAVPPAQQASPVGASSLPGAPRRHRSQRSSACADVKPTRTSGPIIAGAALTH